MARAERKSQAKRLHDYVNPFRGYYEFPSPTRRRFLSTSFTLARHLDTSAIK